MIHILGDGQSLMTAPTLATSQLGALTALLPMDRYTIDMVANGGTPYSNRQASFIYRVRVPADREVLMIDCGGQTDISSVIGLNLTAAAALTAMETYWDTAKAAGVDKIIACTLPKATAAAAYAGDDDTVRQTLNASIAASAHIDGVADIAALAHAGDPTNATYFSDGLHPTAVLAAEFAGVVRDRMAAMGYPVL